MLEETSQRLIEHFLDYFEFVLRPLLKQLIVNAPVLKLHLEHVVVVLLLLVELAAVPYEVDHQAESERVPVDEYLLINFLQGVAT